MEARNLFEKLVDLSPGMEIWWDSSPVIFDTWCRKMLAKAKSDQDRQLLQKQFDRMYAPTSPRKTIVSRGDHQSFAVVAGHSGGRALLGEGYPELIDQNPGIDTEGLFWKLYKTMVKRGSDMYLPLFKASGFKEGFLSGQVDPRKVFDKQTMIQQAEEIASLNPNVMVKVPGTQQGYEVIEHLTAKGISTNNTLTFVLPQLLDCARSVQRGLETAKKNGVNLTQWRSVITHMESRYGDLGGLRDVRQGKRH